MKEIVVNITPFVLKQNIFIREKNNITSIQIPQKEIASYISLNEDISTVHLFGHEKIAKKIQEECMTKYNINNIKFKINC